jgi:phosphoglycerol transferase MdoB-like AlkP superfamily enzyme
MAFFYMTSRIKFLLSYLLLWIIFFQLSRLIFILYHFQQTRQLTIKTDLLTFVYGLRMDVSMASYILLPVCLFVMLGVYIQYFNKAIIYKIYTGVILFFLLVIILADLEVYKHWGFRIDATPLKYLSTPKEAWASVSHLPLLLIIIVFIVVYLLFFILLGFSIHKITRYLKATQYKAGTLIVLLIFLGVLFVPIRGGLQLAPINQSSVYFSTNNFANIAAINAPWNFLHGLMNTPSSKNNPYTYFNEQEANAIVDSLFTKSASTTTVLNNDTPNVLFIIWESFTDKATQMVINGTDVTPYFNSLKKEGIYFDNVYASGDRTDKGIAAILSGYPALNKTSIIRTPNKAVKLPQLSNYFSRKGYTTSFYYGGEPEFANIKSYLLSSGYQTLIDKNFFSKDDQNSKWGAHDGVVAEKLLKDLAKKKSPFFTTWLTLSSHEPFEIPTEPVIKGSSHTNKFLNSIYYTDYVLSSFIEQCKAMSWWDNTLVVIIADHGHHLPETTNRVNNFKIPMLWLGGALKYKGMVVDKIISQTDVASSIIYQTNGNPLNYKYSKNIFDSTSGEWAFFTFNDGFGFVDKSSSLLFDNVGKHIIAGKINPDFSNLNRGKALQQKLYEDYMNK